VAALLFLDRRGPVRIPELAAFLDRTTGQPQVAAFRRLGLVTLAGAARDKRLSLTARGARLASVFAERLDPLWSRATAGLSRVRQAAVLHALSSVGGRPAVEPDTSHFPIELIVLLDLLLARLVSDTLSFVDSPELGEAALRPLLLLAAHPATAWALGVELGIGSAAVNLGVGPALGIGLVERHQNRLHLTMSGNQAVRRHPTPSGWTFSEPAEPRLKPMRRSCWSSWVRVSRRALATEVVARQPQAGLL
jgi:hypothetical protein